MADSTRGDGPTPIRPVGTVAARLWVGGIVLVSTEVLSGASLQIGLWHPWTMLVTYWLYFAHFFLLATLAVRTGRTSLSALYLWGVLFGLYESWITKVIWFGYGGDGKLVLGAIGPFGFGEISMVFIFHPVMAFLLPLSVLCMLCPAVRPLFPDLARFTGRTREAWALRLYLVVSFVPIMVMNSGGAANLAFNLAFAFAALGLLYRRARPALASPDGRTLLVWRGRALAALIGYLALLYIATYFGLRPEGLPAWPVQVFTLAVYGVIAAALWAHPPRTPDPAAPDRFDARLSPSIWGAVAALFGLALAGTLLDQPEVFYPTIALNAVFWTVAGLGMTLLALARGPWERAGRRGRDRRKTQRPAAPLP